MFRERDVDERKCVLLKIPRCDIDGVKGSDRNFEAFVWPVLISDLGGTAKWNSLHF